MQDDGCDVKDGVILSVFAKFSGATLLSDTSIDEAEINDRSSGRLPPQRESVDATSVSSGTAIGAHSSTNTKESNFTKYEAIIKYFKQIFYNYSVFFIKNVSNIKIQKF